jgi:excisionase family DNA binding protein
LQIPDNIIETAISLKDGYFDLPGLARYCSLKVPTLRDHIRSGNLPAFKVKGKILIKKSEFDRWIEAFRINRSKDIDSIVSGVMNDLSGV